jgi:flagellar basal body-associated protein FliL
LRGFSLSLTHLTILSFFSRDDQAKDNGPPAKQSAADPKEESAQVMIAIIIIIIIIILLQTLACSHMFTRFCRCGFPRGS